MKKGIKLLCFLVLIFTLSIQCFSQTEEDIKKIVSETNVSVLNELNSKYTKEFKEKKDIALQRAREKGWIIRSDTNGNVMELQFIDKKGFPKYYITSNANAAATTSTHHVYSGGGLGLSLDGTNMKAGLWDAGNVRVTHQEFNNTGSPRVVNKEVFTEHTHSTHVAGTIAAGGVNSAAKGMAFNANIDDYEWSLDAAEIAAAAAAGLLISNHSYGMVCGWYFDGIDWHWYGDVNISTVEDFNFGFYDSYSTKFDTVAYNAPFLLMVKSAGNEAFDAPAPQPYSHKVMIDGDWVTSTDVRDINGGTDGYDCLSSWCNSKNVLTVGNVEDIPSGYTQPSDVIINSFSSRGPTDDGRIKPDIVGNGINLYSSDINNTSNSYYSFKSGTSMSSPNVTGSLLLLQEHYNERYASFMKAATLKALVIHTADECGSSEGPDYIFGWGLLNTASAANVITNKDSYSFIKEVSVANGATYTFDVSATGAEPLIVTIAWTDPAGTPVADQLNPTDKMLVNDLDLIVEKSGSTYYPYILDGQNPANAATKGNNSTDNVEKVYIANPTAGTYSIVVDHKGTLTNDPQNFSVIITGITNNFPVVTTNSVTNIAKSSADIAGEVVNDYGNNITERGFVYNTTGNPSISDNKIIVGSGTGSFSTTLTGLTFGETYYAKAYATNAIGTYYGAQIDFTTLCEVITVFPFLEDFNASSYCPNCWQTEDLQGNGHVWQFGKFVPFGPSPPTFVTTGNYAFFNNEAYGSGYNQNSNLISPTFDFSGYNSVTLSFHHYFKSYTASSGTLYYSIDDGSSWVSVRTWTSTLNPTDYTKTWTTGQGPVNQPLVKFKWNYLYTGSSNGLYWSVDSIRVAATPLNSLIVSNAQTISSNIAYQDVNVEHDGKLTIAADKILTVAGNFTVESNIEGTGSFVDNGTLNVAGNTIVQKYLPNNTTHGWTLSLPVADADETVFDGSDAIYFYNSSTPAWQEFTSGTLQQMTGYVVRFPDPKTINFSGDLNNGNFSRSNLIRTASPPNYGWNYVGNPYPSPIDWDIVVGADNQTFVNSTNLGAAVYIRKSDGGIINYIPNLESNDTNRFIPAMQAFWTKVVIGQTSGTLSLDNSSRTHGDNNNINKSTTANVIRLKVDRNGYNDVTAVYFKNGATDMFDPAYDANKVYSENDQHPQIYSVVNNEEYAINTLPLLTGNVTVPLGFNTKDEGTHSITASNVNSFNNVRITLEDLYNNVMTDLNQQNTYSFNSNIAASSDRFLIHFNAISINNNQNVSIYAYDNAVYITNVSNDNTTVCIYNMLGQEVISQKLVNNTLNRLATYLTSGQYIVKVISNDQTATQKVYLK